LVQPRVFQFPGKPLSHVGQKNNSKKKTQKRNEGGGGGITNLHTKSSPEQGVQVPKQERPSWRTGPGCKEGGKTLSGQTPQLALHHMKGHNPRRRKSRGNKTEKKGKKKKRWRGGSTNVLLTRSETGGTRPTRLGEKPGTRTPPTSDERGYGANQNRKTGGGAENQTKKKRARPSFQKKSGKKENRSENKRKQKSDKKWTNSREKKGKEGEGLNIQRMGPDQKGRGESNGQRKSKENKGLKKGSIQLEVKRKVKKKKQKKVGEKKSRGTKSTMAFKGLATQSWKKKKSWIGDPRTVASTSSGRKKSKRKKKKES